LAVQTAKIQASDKTNIVEGRVLGSGKTPDVKGIGSAPDAIVKELQAALVKDNKADPKVDLTRLHRLSNTCKRGGWVGVELFSRQHDSHPPPPTLSQQHLTATQRDETTIVGARIRNERLHEVYP
jgi:hypothetical protein